MSLALDLGLFFRNSKTKLGLSLTHRGLLFTLAFRIGSNSSTWIKQSTLAKETGIDERNIRENMNKIKSSGIIITEYQKSDKRKLQYRFSKLLTNYHLLNDEEKAKVHLQLNDEYEHLNVSKHKSSDKKYRMKSSANSESTGRNHPVDTGRNHPLISENDPPETPLDTASCEVDCAPKEKGESNIKNKEKAFHPVDNFKIDQKIELPDWLPKENWEEFKQHRISLKKPLSKLAEKKAINRLAKLKDEGNNVIEIIDNAIFRGWEGLFPIQDQKYQPKNHSKLKQDQKISIRKPCDNEPEHPDYQRKMEERRYWTEKHEQIRLEREKYKQSQSKPNQKIRTTGNIMNHLPKLG